MSVSGTFFLLPPLLWAPLDRAFSPTWASAGADVVLPPLLSCTALSKAGPFAPCRQPIFRGLEGRASMTL